MPRPLTHWHDLLDATARGDVTVVVTRERSYPHGKFGWFDLAKFRETASLVGSLPRFVIAKDVLALAMSNEATRSVADMKKCGVFRLPFRQMAVEFLANDTPYTVVLSEEDDGAVSTLVFGSYEDGGKTIVLAFPTAVTIDLVEDGDDYCYEARASSASYCPTSISEIGDLVDDGSRLALNRSLVALQAALVGTQAIGLRQTPSRATPVLDRIRARKGRAPVPKYTVIDVGSLTTASGEVRRSGEAGSIGEPFLRRGHARRVAVGVGRTGRQWHWFPPQVVGYRPDGYKPSVVEMIAERALRPYVKRTRTAAPEAPAAPSSAR